MNIQLAKNRAREPTYHREMYSDTRREMRFINFMQINLNQILLLAVGLWPYKQSKLTQFQLALCFVILISLIVFQVCVNIIKYTIT